jgi:hypothetical protein
LVIGDESVFSLITDSFRVFGNLDHGEMRTFPAKYVIFNLLIWLSLQGMDWLSPAGNFGIVAL